jgi:hypothetical protein
MKPRYLSIAIVLILANYLIFATIFTWLIEYDFNPTHKTAQTPLPTFTPAPVQAPIFIPTRTPAAPIPTATNTRVVTEIETQLNPTTPTPASIQKGKLVAPGTVNMRAGPGTNYEIIGQLNANVTMPVIGRNPEGSWWQIELNDNRQAWIAGNVVQVSNVEQVSIKD